MAVQWYYEVTCPGTHIPLQPYFGGVTPDNSLVFLIAYVLTRFLPKCMEGSLQKKGHLVAHIFNDIYTCVTILRFL